MLAVPFLLVFIAGLAAAVYSMLHGVTPAPAAGVTTRIGMNTAPSVAAFAIAFGAIGYLSTTRTMLSYPLVLVIALAGGAATIVVSAPLLTNLARSRKANSADEPEIGGQPATVTFAVSDSIAGEVSYHRDGREHKHPALNIISGTLNPGRDVVIDRISDGVAYVEDWDSVEKQL